MTTSESNAPMVKPGMNVVHTGMNMETGIVRDVFLTLTGHLGGLSVQWSGSPLTKTTYLTSDEDEAAEMDQILLVCPAPGVPGPR